MKTIRTLSAFLFVIASTNAQNVKIDVYDILQKLIPDQGKTASWQSAQDNSKGSVTWINARPTQQIIGYNIIGDSKIDYNKQPIKCDGKPCVTSISLNGSTMKAYEEIEFNAAPDNLPTVQLDKLFGKKEYTAKTLKKDVDEMGGAMYYEVQFPGKPLVWIQTSTIPAYREEQSNDFSLTVFFIKKQMMSRMQ